MGEVINDYELMENQYLYDEKEIYLQIINKEKTFNFYNDKQPNNCYYILIREWNP